MTFWSDDFSACSLEEVLRSQAENRAWGKELRRKTCDAVESRLTGMIDRAEYLVIRKITQKDTEEYRRRANLLEGQVSRRLGSRVSD